MPRGAQHRFKREIRTPLPSSPLRPGSAFGTSTRLVGAITRLEIAPTAIPRRGLVKKTICTNSVAGSMFGDDVVKSKVGSGRWKRVVSHSHRIVDGEKRACVYEFVVDGTQPTFSYWNLIKAAGYTHWCSNAKGWGREVTGTDVRA